MLVKRIKKLFRLITLVCLVVLALCGIGINGAGPLASHNRERYIDNGIKIEFVQTKDEEGNSQEEAEAKF